MEKRLEMVPFQGDTLYAVEHEGEAFIPVKPVILNLGLTWSGQHIKLYNRAKRWTVTMIVTVAQDGKKRDTVCIPLRKLAGFLSTINPSKVRPDLVDKLELYQDECDDVLAHYWNNRGIYNPIRKLPETHIEAVEAYLAELRTVQQMKITAAENEPLIKYAQNTMATEDTVDIGKLAKHFCKLGLKIGRTKLYAFLRENKYLMRNNIPYQIHVDNGNFIVDKRHYETDTSNGPREYFITKVTGKGQLAIEKALRKHCRG